MELDAKIIVRMEQATIKRKMEDNTHQTVHESKNEAHLPETPPKKKMESALSLEVVATWKKARVTKLKLPHFLCDTPMFMPVGTQGTIKGLTVKQLEELDCHVILGNTYHLGRFLVDLCSSI